MMSTTGGGSSDNIVVLEEDVLSHTVSEREVHEFATQLGAGSHVCRPPTSRELSGGGTQRTSVRTFQLNVSGFRTFPQEN